MFYFFVLSRLLFAMWLYNYIFFQSLLQFSLHCPLTILLVFFLFVSFPDIFFSNACYYDTFIFGFLMFYLKRVKTSNIPIQEEINGLLSQRTLIIAYSNPVESLLIMLTPKIYPSWWRLCIKKWLAHLKDKLFIVV